jgi:hypothetical protein
MSKNREHDGDIHIDAVLREARFVKNRAADVRAPCLKGFVFGDLKGRFPDGEYITTSTLIEALATGVYKTRYSFYEVESWAEGSSAADVVLTEGDKE